MNKQHRCSKYSLRNIRRKGMALPLSLVMLLVAGILVGVSMYIVENMVSVSMMKSRDELLMNGALAGIEHGKIWLTESVRSTGGVPPRRGYAALSQSDLSRRVIQPLLARKGTEQALLDGDLDGVIYQAAVYDVNIDRTRRINIDDLIFVEGVPPFKNRREEEGYGSDSYRYLIRSIASLDEREKIIEQFIELDY